MYLYKIEIENFRLLENVVLLLEEGTTVIVGRNNSGKTSLTELFRRLMSENTPTFRLEDFSLYVVGQFWEAFLLKCQGREDQEIRAVLPVIEIRLTIRYEKEAVNLGPLGDFVIDLNSDCTDVLIVIRYQLREGGISSFFEDIPPASATSPEGDKLAFFRTLKERIPKGYLAIMLAVDPNDSTNQKPMELVKLRQLIQSGFINAQRGLDDITHRDRDVLGKVLETLFDTAKSEAATPKDRDIALKLESAVESLQKEIDDGFNDQLKGLLPAFSLFGYPGLNDPHLLTETTLDVQRLLNNHTRVHCAGVCGVNLPETYNGLGARNLIFILLKLLEFFKSFAIKDTAPGSHLIFIEEPEVHLHPQMQEVFISKLGDIARLFAKEFNEGKTWPVQFVVTTHSSHLANKAPFESMRYFLAAPKPTAGHLHATRIKDLRNGFTNSMEEDREFLHKYMTLTRCDLMFADKAVLIEGTTERLLLPQMIAKVDAEQPDGPQLSSKYLSVVEIGGAYAHRFFRLLDFLELQTLIITDLDAVEKDANDKLVACKVSKGSLTSNGCLKDWFDDPKITPNGLINKSDAEKILENRRLAYELPETVGAACGRSFEDAFILANGDLFGLNGASALDREDEAWEQAKGIKKSDFALRYAIDETTWTVPRYIAEGLRWLAQETCDLATPQVKTGGGPPEENVNSLREEQYA